MPKSVKVLHPTPSKLYSLIKTQNLDLALHVID